jgi:hypothetical protein
VAVVALIFLIVSVGAVRPLARVSRTVLGSTRLALLPEAPADGADGDVALTSPCQADVSLPALGLSGAAPIGLKIRGTGFAPVPVRRLKLPRHTTSSSVPADG